MTTKRLFSAIAIVAILVLPACTDVAGPTGQGPDVASVLEEGSDSGQDTQGQQGKKRDNPLQP